MANYSSALIQMVIIISGGVFTAFGSWSFYQFEQKSIVASFQEEVNERVVSLHRELALNLEPLYSLSILFNSDEQPSMTQFNREAKRMLNRHENIQALEWIPKVPLAQRITYERRQQTQLPGFEITERQKQGVMTRAQERAVYYPVYFIEPMAGNEAAIGFDLGSSPARLNTIQKSISSAQPQLSASITLVQEQKQQQGFLAFLPIYHGLTTTDEQRQKNVVGFVLGVYRIGDIFVNSALDNQYLDIEMELVDESNPAALQTLYSHQSKAGSVAYQGIVYKKLLPEIWGRQWSITAVPTNDYMAIRRGVLPLVVAIAGFLLTCFVTGYVGVISHRTKTIQKIVLEKTFALNEANRALEKLSRIDSLTAVANRRSLDEHINKEWQRAIRQGWLVSFIIIDVDFFKQYNDNYGHVAGDECLKKIASQLQACVKRSADLLARYGGEEFAIVLIDTQDAEVVAQRCRQAVAALELCHEYSSVADKITISVGLCTALPQPGSDPSLIVELADKALYLAKNSGRNRVETCDYISELAQATIDNDSYVI